jgi:hypothetical protein
MPQQSSVYIVVSPQPRVGKTLIARLLIEFCRSGSRPVAGYDLNPREPVLAGCFPELVVTVDIAETRGQMTLFDRLVGDAAVTAVIDVGHDAFERLFAVADEIGFVAEARRRALEPIVLYVADQAPATARTYAELRRRLPETIVVPVHNEAVSATFDKQVYPPSRRQCRMLHIPRLPPAVHGVIDRPGFRFATNAIERPGEPTELQAWSLTVFTEFRELELRLLMGRIGSALGAASSQAEPPPGPQRA